MILWRFVNSFEPLTYWFLIENARENDVFLDIGAHIGIYTVRLAKRVSKVIALEPEPKNYNLLRRNIIINRVNDKTVALPIAASNVDGYTYLCVKRGSGAHTLEDLRNCIKKVKLVTLRMDTLLRILDIEKVDIVKIDVEGHKNKVVSGMREILRYSPPRVLVIEIRRKSLNLLKYFVKKGYRVRVLDHVGSAYNCGFTLRKTEG